VEAFPWKDCKHVYIDVGSNRGIQVMANFFFVECKEDEKDGLEFTLKTA